MSNIYLGNGCAPGMADHPWRSWNSQRKSGRVTSVVRQRTAPSRVNGCKLPEFNALQASLWIRRVLVRAQEGQLPKPPRGGFVRFRSALSRSAAARSSRGGVTAQAAGARLLLVVVDQVYTMVYIDR